MQQLPEPPFYLRVALKWSTFLATTPAISRFFPLRSELSPRLFPTFGWWHIHIFPILCLHASPFNPRYNSSQLQKLYRYKTNKHTLVLSRGWQHVLMPILADFCVGCFTLASSSNSTHSLCNFCFGAVAQTFLRQLRAGVSLFYFKLRRWTILPIELKRYKKYGW